MIRAWERESFVLTIVASSLVARGKGEGEVS